MAAALTSIFGPTHRASGLHGAESVVHWDEGVLRDLVVARLSLAQVIVVSDRQPFSHSRDGRGPIKVAQPASGLVTAVEPIVRACGGTWIAHGSGNADREVVDDLDVWHAPEKGGSLRLRRVWLPADEARGYRDGFSNSGLWPLCHVVHVRPTFTEQDWQHYERVNRRFAEAITEEARQPDPIVLIHDYHLDLVPAMLRKNLPRATTVCFWHIPWTPPEQMGICPWLPQLVDGLLGSDIVGFQTEQHRKNFVATVERSGRQAVSQRRGDRPRRHKTLVRDYPISVAWPEASVAEARAPVATAGLTETDCLPLPFDGKLVVSIDRFDYTKGLVERLRAIEHLLEVRPEWRGRLRFVQVAAPSRTTLHDYVTFREYVLAETRRINARFSANGWEPISLRDTQHDRAAVNAMYRSADLCLVTSLHDGMNLVCKEFVASRDDEQGVLVLSQFAGASHELTSALIVNPYYTAQVADALHRGLSMTPAEQRNRMQSMRATVKKHNVYRWAGSMLLDAARLRDRREVELPSLPLCGATADA